MLEERQCPGSSGEEIAPLHEYQSEKVAGGVSVNEDAALTIARNSHRLGRVDSFGKVGSIVRVGQSTIGQDAFDLISQMRDTERRPRSHV